MTLTCPCCKATNDTATCRRCKADLTLMADLESQRDWALDRARSMAHEGDWQGALLHLKNAELLRRDDTSTKIRVLLENIPRHRNIAECRSDG